MGDRRADHTHVELTFEILIACKPTCASQQGAVFEPRDALADDGHGPASAFPD